MPNPFLEIDPLEQSQKYGLEKYESAIYHTSSSGIGEMGKRAYNPLGQKLAAKHAYNEALADEMLEKGRWGSKTLAFDMPLEYAQGGPTYFGAPLEGAPGTPAYAYSKYKIKEQKAIALAHGRLPEDPRIMSGLEKFWEKEHLKRAPWEKGTFRTWYERSIQRRGEWWQQISPATLSEEFTEKYGMTGKRPEKVLFGQMMAGHEATAWTAGTQAGAGVMEAQGPVTKFIERGVFDPSMGYPVAESMKNIHYTPWEAQRNFLTQVTGQTKFMKDPITGKVIPHGRYGIEAAIPEKALVSKFVTQQEAERVVSRYGDRPGKPLEVMRRLFQRRIRGTEGAAKLRGIISEVAPEYYSRDIITGFKGSVAFGEQLAPGTFLQFKGRKSLGVVGVISEAGQYTIQKAEGGITTLEKLLIAEETKRKAGWFEVRFLKGKEKVGVMAPSGEVLGFLPEEQAKRLLIDPKTGREITHGAISGKGFARVTQERAYAKGVGKLAGEHHLRITLEESLTGYRGVKVDPYAIKKFGELTTAQEALKDIALKKEKSSYLKFTAKEGSDNLTDFLMKKYPTEWSGATTAVAEDWLSKGATKKVASEAALESATKTSLNITKKPFYKSAPFIVGSTLVAGALLVYGANRLTSRKRPLDERDIPASQYGDIPMRYQQEGGLNNYTPTARVIQNNTGYNTDINIESEDMEGRPDYNRIAMGIGNIARTNIGVHNAGVNLNIVDDSIGFDSQSMGRMFAEYIDRGSYV